MRQVISPWRSSSCSAGREVSPELWRCVGPHASGEMVDDLRRALASEVRAEALAAGLALSACPQPEAAGPLGDHPDIEQAIRAGEVSWQSLAGATP